MIDASALLRLFLKKSPQAAAVVRRDSLAAPAVVVPETLNGLATAVRFNGLELENARSLLRDFLGLPIELVTDAQLSHETLAVSAELGLSAYDASYVTLAARRDLPLVTADQRVAERYGRSELIP